MIAVHYILRSDALFFGTDRDGHPVLVGASDKDYVFFFQSEITDINICRHINSCEMSDMDRPVCIRQCRSYGGTFEFLFHCIICISFVMNAFISCKDSGFLPNIYILPDSFQIWDSSLPCENE